MRNRKLRAVLWDQMHYMLRRYNDRMTHIALIYDGEIDPSLLKDSFRLLLDASPVLTSRFVPSAIRPYWSVADCTADDLFTLCDTDDPEAAAMDFLLNEIPADGPGQVRLGLFRCGRHQVLAMLTNHMCMDGSGLLTFLRTLSRNYDALAGNGAIVPVRTGSRSHAKIYADYPLSFKLRAQLLFRYRGKIRSSPVFPQTAPDPHDRRRIVYRSFPGEIAGAVRSYSEKHGVTRHEVLTAAVMSVLYEMCDVAPDHPLAVNCAIDLRRHMKDFGKSSGLTNHTAWLSCRVDGCPRDFSELVTAVHDCMKQAKDDPYTGLYTLPLLNLGCSVVPYFITEPIVARVYSNPPLGVSNVGTLKSEDYSFGSARLTGGHLSGTVKKKPGFMLTIAAFEDHFVITDAFFGSDADCAYVETFFDKLEARLRCLPD